MQALVDPGVVEAHERAVQKVLRDLERVTQGELVMATWQHRVSRANDPQLHTHVAVMNVAHDERGWHALRNNRELFDNQKAFTREYRAELLGGLERQGYTIQYPEIAGISEEMRDKYSQRAQQIYQRVDAYEAAHGIEPSGNVVQTMVLQSRPAKDHRTAREIMEEQFERLTPGERVELQSLAAEANHRMQPQVSPEIQQHMEGIRQPSPAVEKREVEEPKPALRQDVNFDPALPKYRWDYGKEGEQRGPGFRMG